MANNLEVQKVRAMIRLVKNPMKRVVLLFCVDRTSLGFCPLKKSVLIYNRVERSDSDYNWHAFAVNQRFLGILYFTSRENITPTHSARGTNVCFKSYQKAMRGQGKRGLTRRGSYKDREEAP